MKTTGNHPGRHYEKSFTYVLSQGVCNPPYFFHILLWTNNWSPLTQNHFSSLTFSHLMQWAPIHAASLLIKTRRVTKLIFLCVLRTASLPPYFAHSLTACCAWTSLLTSQNVLPLSCDIFFIRLEGVTSSCLTISVTCKCCKICCYKGLSRKSVSWTVHLSFSWCFLFYSGNDYKQWIKLWFLKNLHLPFPSKNSHKIQQKWTEFCNV